MNEEDSLAIFTKAEAMLAEANTIQSARELKILALTAADWARRKGMGEKAIQHCRSYALEAERKMGAMLEMKPPASGQWKVKRDIVSPFDATFTLAEIGLEGAKGRKESERAKWLSKLARPLFELIKFGKKTRKQVQRELQREAVQTKVNALPTGKYRVLYCDPPWNYSDQLTEDYGPTQFHYKSLTISELCALPIADLAYDDAVLFLWVTSPILPEAFTVIRAWEFTYKASFVWDKIKHNLGHYNSVRHEFLLVCTRGSCLPDSPKLIDSVQSIERTDHSKKPKEFRTIIETMYSFGDRVELFGREKVIGWSVWGDQVQ